MFCRVSIALGFVVTLSGCLTGTEYGPGEKLPTIDHIIVDKGQRKLCAYCKDEEVVQYKVSIGKSPQGHKQREGDHKTPEGEYTIVAKHPKHKFHKALAISFPNKQDREKASKKGYNPGGGIHIHGYQPHLSWVSQKHTLTDATRGCVLLTNQEMDQIFEATPIGTKVTIRP